MFFEILLREADFLIVSIIDSYISFLLVFVISNSNWRFGELGNIKLEHQGDDSHGERCAIVDESKDWTKWPEGD